MRGTIPRFGCPGDEIPTALSLEGRVRFAGPSRLSISDNDRLQTHCTGASLELSMLASSAEGHTSLKVAALAESIRGHSNKHLKEPYLKTPMFFVFRSHKEAD